MSILDTTFMLLNKKDWYLGYTADIKSLGMHINISTFFSDFISEFISINLADLLNSSELTESEIITRLQSIVTADDNIDITEYGYGHGDDDESVGFVFLVILIYYLLYKTIMVFDPDISRETIETCFYNTTTILDILVETTSVTQISNEVPVTPLNNYNHCYLYWVDVLYVSDIKKFNSRYISFLESIQDDINDPSYIIDWYHDVITEFVEIQDNLSIQPFYRVYIDWEDVETSISDHSSKLVLEYGDKSYTFYTEPSVSNIIEYITDESDAENIFNIHEAAYNDNKFLHFKVYSNRPVTYFPLPIVPITISSVSFTEMYDGQPHVGSAGISEGTVANGDQITITPIAYTLPGTYQNGFVYQITYAQPQARVYDVTRDCGEAIINRR